MESEFRKADLIELHDAQLVVHTDDFGDVSNWRMAPTVRGNYVSVDGDGLAHLLEALGVTFDADLLFGYEFNILFRPPFTMDHGQTEVSLPDTPRIKEIWVRPENSNLLHVHLLIRMGETEDEYVQELTYSGHFTVWWALAEE
jgi:hypothetical protein